MLKGAGDGGGGLGGQQHHTEMILNLKTNFKITFMFKVHRGEELHTNLEGSLAPAAFSLTSKHSPPPLKFLLPQSKWAAP